MTTLQIAKAIREHAHSFYYGRELYPVVLREIKDFTEQPPQIITRANVKNGLLWVLFKGYENLQPVDHGYIYFDNDKYLIHGKNVLKVDEFGRSVR